MREILFRGKRIDNGEWVEGCYVNCKGPGCSTNETRHYIVEYPEKWHEVYTSTVSQFTGLTDKNGKNIFEGDIMEFDAYGLYYKGVVSFVDGNFCIICNRPTASPFLDYAMKRYDAICVGNIHDNRLEDFDGG